MTTSSNNNGVVSTFNHYQILSNEHFSFPDNQLMETEKQIEVEKSFTNDFLHNIPSYKAFDWHFKVLTGFIKNLMSSNQNLGNVRSEDLPLAAVISKTWPVFCQTHTLDLEYTPEKECKNFITEEMRSRITDDTPPLFISKALLKNWIEFENISNVLKKAISRNNIALMKAVIKQYPEEFKAELTRKDNIGLTPAGWAIAQNNHLFEHLFIMAEAAPEEFKTALTMQDNLGHTLLSLLVLHNSLEIVEFVANIALKEFKESLTLQNKDGDTPLALAVIDRNIKMLKIIVKFATDEFKKALILQNDEGDTPVSLVSCERNFNEAPVSLARIERNIKMLKIMAESAMEEFNIALTMQNNEGLTPISMARLNSQILNYMNQISPKTFQLASAKRDHWGYSVLDLAKENRPQNLSEISKLFKKNCQIRRVNKEISNRMALSHFFGISGISDVISAYTRKIISSINLEGGRSPPWFNLIEKDLHRFKKAYPHCLSEKEMKTLQDACRFEADHCNYTLRERFDAIKAGAGIVGIGYLGHEITLVIKDDWFVICNRGEASRRPVDFFRFNPQKFSFDIFKKIVNLRSGTREDYENLFFNELPGILKFVKTDLILELEKNNALFPEQTVGNCSLVSPITALYAYRLLLEVNGMKKVPIDIENRMQNVLDWYHIWLTFQQISVLKRGIKPLEHADPLFEPDHTLVVKCLRRAHLLNLDNLSSKRLVAITQIYVNSLNPIKGNILKRNLAKLNSLEKQLLL
ncbi:MAG TPA: hypothetical protein VGP47_09810 [Parachlamydiaceae bacterium]|nr:hypothetical protein [Parachlamydiaceae bacterium]